MHRHKGCAQRPDDGLHCCEQFPSLVMRDVRILQSWNQMKAKNGMVVMGMQAVPDVSQRLLRLNRYLGRGRIMTPVGLFTAQLSPCRPVHLIRVRVNKVKMPNNTSDTVTRLQSEVSLNVRDMVPRIVLMF